MINYLRGKVVRKGNRELLLDVNGFGFEIFVPSRDLSLIKEEEEIVFYVYFNYKGDNLELFGFLDENDRNFFEKLVSLTKIGTRVSFEILDRFSWKEFMEIIESEDVSLLSSIPKVGEKRAKRIVFELKGEILSGEGIFSEVKEALLSLGYTEREANKALLKIAKSETKGKGVEMLLKEALSVLKGDK
ncbi:MAG: Holliday junction branch migration protein RuvA [Synergistetes bacterium]|nr:MAG: Holliday junction ATP-dependent DNA helicase RuvA [bacterium 42_11]MBC7331454.1 Holliday junction branch migration protein RuvA [Synergistota bacterium]MDK2871207.1 holliday junction helicase RuvA [bacterium]